MVDSETRERWVRAKGTTVEPFNDAEEWAIGRGYEPPTCQEEARGMFTDWVLWVVLVGLMRRRGRGGSNRLDCVSHLTQPWEGHGKTPTMRGIRGASEGGARLQRSNVLDLGRLPRALVAEAAPSPPVARRPGAGPGGQLERPRGDCALRAKHAIRRGGDVNWQGLRGGGRGENRARDCAFTAGAC